MPIVQSAFDDLFAIRWEQPLNWIPFGLLAVMVMVTAALLRWGGLARLGRLDDHRNGVNLGIEGIRGPLAFFVIIAHYLSVQKITLDGSFGRISVDHERMASSAGLAVCYFFAITGFLFWSKFLNNPDTDVRRMFYGRVLRIVPAFLAVCVVSLGFIAISDPPAYAKPLSILARQIASIFALGYYDANLSQWVLLDVGPTWTLFWEMLFYATLPFLFLLRRIAGPWVFHIALPVMLAYWNPQHQMLFIWAGTVVAEFAFALGSRPRAIDRLLIAAAPVIFVFSMLRGEYLGSPWHALETCFVVLALARGSTFYGVLRLPALQALGRVGYSTYLVHGLVIHAAVLVTSPVFRFDQLTNAELGVFFVCLTPAIVLVSVLSFRFLERPFLQIRTFPWEKTTVTQPVGAPSPRSEPVPAATPQSAAE